MSVEIPGDHLIRALLPEHGVRVIAAVSPEVTREAARRYGAAGGVVAVLGRSATAGLLLATLTKGHERITAELSGDGPLGKILVDADADGQARVYIKNPTIELPALPYAHVPVHRALGAEGVVRVARDLALREVVSGQTPLWGSEIDVDLEHYLETSEQIPSVLGCETLLGADLDVAASGGILLQTLPGSEALPLMNEVRARLRAGALTAALQNRPGIGAEALAETLLGSLAASLLVLDTRPLAFHCRCSRERASATISLFDDRELDEMSRQPEGTEVTCEFCHARYRFAPEEVGRLRAESRRPPPS